MYEWIQPWSPTQMSQCTNLKLIAAKGLPSLLQLSIQVIAVVSSVIDLALVNSRLDGNSRKHPMYGDSSKSVRRN